MGVILITGSTGLVGSTAADYFCSRGHTVYGLDNNMRMKFFGADASTDPMLEMLQAKHESYHHHCVDIRDLNGVRDLVRQAKFDLVIHAAGQPSHDLAAKIPLIDWDVNATGTMVLLEAVRQSSPDAVFVYLSTNKVYGDNPNKLLINERPTRYSFADPLQWEGIDDSMSIDCCLHSLFGASKAAADLMVQEYGRYFGMRTCCLRCGCLTGPNHAGVELHGFLNYLVKCNVTDRVYKIFGHKGKQVRDNIHATDVAAFIDAFWTSPRPGAVYNLGGGRTNSCSILEAFQMVEAISGKPMRYEYVPEARLGDHIVYYTDLRKAWRDYPKWDISIPLKSIIKQIHDHYARPRTSPCDPDSASPAPSP